MCYHSAEGHASRPGVLGEPLVIAQLNEHAVGLVSPANTALAVCIQPGTVLIFEDIPETRQRQWGVGPEARAKFKTVAVGLTAEQDAIVFDEQPDKSIDFQSCIVGTKVFIDFIPATSEPEAAHGHPAERIPEFA